MSYLDVLRAEYRLIYGELVRRKSALLAVIAYPYIFTLFILTIGSATGSLEVFATRVGVNPVIYMITGSYLLLTILTSIDDLLWRSIYDTNIGTMIYIMASPVNKLVLYSSIPIPRLTIVVLIGFTSLIPVYVYINGLKGITISILVMAMSIIGCLVMIPFAVLLASSIHRISDSWRILGVVRPVIMILLGVYYPRIYLPFAGYLIGSLIPPSHVVEIIQRMLIGMHGNTIFLVTASLLLALIYYPLAEMSLRRWEKAKVREGVKTS
ncbi:MAG: ABC transporter permease [Desulfurococcaceae archaeon]